MKRFLALSLMLTIPIGCNQSSQSSLSVAPTSLPPAKIADATMPAKLQSQESPEIRHTTVEEITDQSFNVDLKSWGKVHFVSAKRINGDGHIDLLLTLKDSEGNDLYTFPKPKLVESWDFYSVKAVSFKDLNQDRKKDIIVLADYITGRGSDGSVPFTVPTIYIQKDKEFLSDLDLDNSLFSSGKVTTVNDVVTYFTKKSEPVIAPLPTKTVPTIEEVNNQLCSRVLASNMTEDEIIQTYYDEYVKQKFNLSETGEDQMFGYIGGCFEQEMDKLIKNNGKMSAEVNAIYKALTESISHLFTIDYIRNGGGTMWGHNERRQIGLYKYYMNKYVKMKQEGYTAAPQKYDALANTLDSQMEKLKNQGVKGLEEFTEPQKGKEAEKDFDSEFLSLKAAVQNFKELTSEKDDACIFLLKHLMDRVGSSINE